MRDCGRPAAARRRAQGRRGRRLRVVCLQPAGASRMRSVRAGKGGLGGQAGCRGGKGGRDAMGWNARGGELQRCTTRGAQRCSTHCSCWAAHAAAQLVGATDGARAMMRTSFTRYHRWLASIARCGGAGIGRASASAKLSPIRRCPHETGVATARSQVLQGAPRRDRARVPARRHAPFPCPARANRVRGSYRWQGSLSP